MADDLKNLYDRLKKEVEISEEIKWELGNVCNYMWTHKLQMISMEYATGVNFKITMEIDEELEEAADDKRKGADASVKDR